MKSLPATSAKRRGRQCLASLATALATLSSFAAHADLGIRKSDFHVLVEVLQVAMETRGIPFRAQNRLLALLAPMHRDIITR